MPPKGGYDRKRTSNVFYENPQYNIHINYYGKQKTLNHPQENWQECEKEASHNRLSYCDTEERMDEESKQNNEFEVHDITKTYQKAFLKNIVRKDKKNIADFSRTSEREEFDQQGAYPDKCCASTKQVCIIQ